MITAEQLHMKVLERIDLTRQIDERELQDVIYEVLEELSKKQFIPLKKKAELGKEVFQTFRRLDVIQDLIEDDSVTEIMINGTETIFIERQGEIIPAEKAFVSRSRLEDIIQQIVAECNRIVNEASPIVDARLKDGSRVNVVLPPVAINGPIVTIRKFPKKKIRMEDLLRFGTLSQEVAEFLILLVKAKYNIFISGGTGSGKTTFLNVLSDYIPKQERLVVIEDNAELQIDGIKNIVRLEARNSNMEGIGEITIRDLIKAALRMRPDRIIVGEVRGEEAIDMLQAFNTGHDGSLSTGHANAPKDMLSRLETMVLTGMEIPLSAIQRQIASGVDILIHLGRLRDKSRKLLSVMEVIGIEKDEIQLRSIYHFEERKVEDGIIEGEWVKDSSLRRTDKLMAAGYQ